MEHCQGEDEPGEAKVRNLVLVAMLALGGCALHRSHVTAVPVTPIAPVEPHVIVATDKCRGGCPDPVTIDPAQLPPLPKFE